MCFSFLNNEVPANILVIGDIMLDHYLIGSCERISPEAPVPVVEIATESFTLGGAGNVVKNLLAFGIQPSIISVIGDDEPGRKLWEELSLLNIDTGFIVRCKERVTTIKTRVLAAKHQLIRLDRETRFALSEATERKVIEKITSVLDKFKVVLISDYSKGMLTTNVLNTIATECNKRNIISIIDPKVKDFSKYRGLDIIKPNRIEARLATGIDITNKESLTQACKSIKEITECKAVIVTLAEDGIAYFSNSAVIQVPTKAVEVYDVTGAGDTVLAALGFALAKGATLAEACNFSNHAAAVVIKKLGSATANIEEIMSS